MNYAMLPRQSVPPTLSEVTLAILKRSRNQYYMCKEKSHYMHVMVSTEDG
jgi:hypothetical protein